MIQLKISVYTKSYNPKSEPKYQYGERQFFDNVKEAKEWINDTYRNNKRQPMYVDDIDGKSKKIGYVIGFRNHEFYNGKRVNFIEQHWIGFERVEELEI